MSVKKYVISKKSSNYTILPNKVLQNLSCEPLGLYCYLASLPPGWNFHKDIVRVHLKIGIHKLNALLCALEDHNLIKTAQIRDAQGRFAHFDIEVDDGTSFKINELQKNEDPFYKNRNTVTVRTEISTYKDNINKNNIYKNNIKNICASDDARHRFEEFWNIYPRKKDKKRSAKWWKDKKLDDKADMILDSLGEQIRNDAQWKTEKYIPHPITYLRNERWNDEVTLERMEFTPKKRMSDIEFLRSI